MIGFYCATPFHVIVAVNMMLNEYKDEPADIYVLNYFPQAIEVVEMLKQTGLFQKVVFINLNNYNIWEKSKRLFHSFIPDKDIRDICNKFSYDNFFFLALDFLNIAFIVKAALRKKSNCSFGYAEDGIGSYIKDIYVPSKTVSRLLRITGRIKYLKYVDKLYVFAPEFVVANRNFKVIGIQKFDGQSVQLKRICSILWPDMPKLKAVNKILYFQQPLGERTGSDTSMAERQLINHVVSEYGVESITVKIHPRVSDCDICSQDIVLESRTPFEIFALEYNTSKNVLISALSTACFTPFLLLGQYPSLIFTYKILGDGVLSLTGDIEKFMNMFESLYRDKGKLFIPETIEEFNTCLKECIDTQN